MMTVLIADIGGTNLRFALADSGGVQRHSIWRGKLKNFKSVYDATRAYLETHDVTLKAACFVIAAPVPYAEADLYLTNYDWHFNKAGLEDVVGAPCYVLNDWEAVGHVLLNTPQAAFKKLTPKVKPRSSMRFACGPGTGLGCCFFNGEEVWPSEAAALPVMDVDVSLAGLAHDFDHLVTGPGMAKIHETLFGTSLNSGSIVKLATHHDKQAEHTLEIFAEAFASFLRMVALTTCPMGGIYIGGFMPSVLEHINKKRFIEQFRTSLKHREMLESIPLYLFEIEDAGLNGAASFLKTRNIFD